MSIARDGNGDILKGTDLGVRIAILDGDLTTIWEEEHEVTTNDDGLFQLIVGDPAATPTGAGYEDYFSDIDWTMQPLYIKTTVSLEEGVWLEMGTAQLFSVPYAMVSNYSYELSDNPFTMNADTVLLMHSVDVVGNYPKEIEEALFEVKRQDGKTMFAVYNQGVRINVPLDDIDPPKGVKGGFSIGGFGSTKGSTTNFMDITQKNYFIGHETGTKTKGSALYNSVMGYQAAKNLSTGTYNTVIGYLADSSLTSGSSNIIIGASAGRELTTGIHNTLIGNSAGLNHTSNEYNVMIGTSAGANLLAKTYSGSFNTFIGINAGYKIKSGKDNTFLGTNAGAMLEVGRGNTIVGIDAARAGAWDPEVYHEGDSTSNNTIIGNEAGRNLAVGHGNVFIGYEAGYDETGTVGSPASNKLYIANSKSSTLIYGDFRVNGSPIATTTLTTGTLTATSPVSLSATREVIGGSAEISIANASTSAKGAVQLSNSYSGTSQTLATTETALSDGLATKVDGAGMILGKIYSETNGTLLSAGGFTLYWDVSGDEISIINDNPFPGGYWYTAKISDPLKEYAVILPEDKVAITGWREDFNGIEIHFGQFDGGGSWCSVWLQYYDGRMVGHYIIN